MTRRKRTTRAQGAPKQLSRKLRDLEAQDGKEVHGGAGSDWQAAKSYRVWEANRKTYLYPENWIEP
jgi:hypothetical protein